MSVLSLVEPDAGAAPLLPLLETEFDSWLAMQPEDRRRWVGASGFRAKAHETLFMPGDPALTLIGLGKIYDRWSFGALPLTLPEGTYRLLADLDHRKATQVALGWSLGAYQFTRYKCASRAPAQLCWPVNADRRTVARDSRAVALVRDLINTPANDLGPAEIATQALQIAEKFGAECTVTVGDELLTANYPLVHAVGRASARAPRLIDLTWGDPASRKLTIVGKGVCFDTGGLNLKDRGPMLLMKLDMGGAAHALALAQMVMESDLPVRLRVLIPAVENAVGGDAVRPRDVVLSRKGLSVEIGDTDAEGRLILADALYAGASEDPDMLIDFATLTGSARVALGTDLTALFTDDDDLAHALDAAARTTGDPVWRLPLWQPYAKDLEGKVADLTNVADLNLGPTTFAGAIYAALFLQRFVEPVTRWLHLDISGWNLRSRPGRPEGGDAFALLATFSFLSERYRAPSE